MKNLIFRGNKPTEQAYEPKTRREPNLKATYLKGNGRKMYFDTRMSEVIRQQTKDEAYRAVRNGIANETQKAIAIHAYERGTLGYLHYLKEEVSKNASDVIISKLIK